MAVLLGKTETGKSALIPAIITSVNGAIVQAKIDGSSTAINVNAGLDVNGKSAGGYTPMVGDQVGLVKIGRQYLAHLINGVARPAGGVSGIYGTCQAYVSTSQAISNATWTTLTMSNAPLNVGNIGTAYATGVTVSKAGLFICTAGVAYPGTASGVKYLRLAVNGNVAPPYGRSSVGIPNSTATSAELSITQVLSLNNGDIVAAQTYQTSGTTQQLQASAESVSMLAVTYLCPNA